MNIDINLVATISIGVYLGWLLIALTKNIFTHKKSEFEKRIRRFID